MMDTPFMQQLLQNPGFMENLVSSNPQIQQLTQNNPELRAVFNDPATIRQMTRIMQNPNLRRELIRNSDRAIANIENLPGGFDELRRLHHSIQEPMEDALTQQFTQQNNQTTSQQTTNTTQTQVDPNRPTTTPLPNPWGPPSTPTTNPFSSFPFGTTGNSPLVPNNNMNPFGGNMPNLSSPAMNQLMTQVMANPQLIQYIASGDIQGAQQYALTNPQILQTMMTPEVMQSALAMMSNNAQNSQNQNNPLNMSLPQMNNQQPNNTGWGGSGMMPGWGSGMGMMPGWGSGMGMMPGLGGMGMMPGWGGMGMMPGWGGYNNMGSVGTNNNNNNTTGAPVGQSGQRYAVQLQQLNDMGFTDNQKNMEALQSTNGNVERAVERILGGQ